MTVDFPYDTECYPNIWTLAIKEAGTDRRWLFEISTRRDNRNELMDFLRYLRTSGSRQVGFNNIGYDWPVVNYILDHPDCTYADIYNFSCSIINRPDDDRWSHIVWEPLITQVDLFKIHHFDNKARSTSLKALEFNMRSKSIEDLPFPPGTWLADWQMDMLISYNWHDVDETEAFYYKSIELIRFREVLSERYHRNFLNHNDTKIGKDFFIMELERIAPGSCYRPGTRRPKQTIREQIALVDVIFPYVEFTRPEFAAVRGWMASQVITRKQFDEFGKVSDGPLKTKGLFNKIPAEQLGPLQQYAALKYIKKTKSHRAENVNCVVTPEAGEPFQFVFGTGGIHGSVTSRIVRSDSEYVILDVDVTSLYPSIGIENRCYPLHLGEIFPQVYGDLKKQRIGYKKGTPENAMLKLALNGVYGDSNNQYSPFYDPQYTMTITINGQLLLCMLADYIMYIPGLEMIQINTDGITCRLPRNQVWIFDEFCKWWEGVTSLELERVEYDFMAIRDVNGYFAVDTKGKIKRKGPYEYLLVEQGGTLGWHQNHSALVVPRAAEARLLHGTPIEQFIRQHADPMDFMLRAKVPRSSRLILGDRQVQNVTRYYVSTTGGALVKIMPPAPKKPEAGERHIGIDVGWLVTECNRLPSEPITNINYEYYIAEAEKLVKPLLD